MHDRTPNDAARRVANVLGAIAQVVAGFFGVAVGLDVGAVSDQNRTTIVPSGYAFAIWGPIFLLALAYAAYQALPRQRTDPLLRRIGWFTAAGFAGNAVWEVLFPARQFVASQVLIVAVWVCLAVAFARIVDGMRAGATAGERWLVALPIGLLFGWLTAATAVGVATTLVALGVAAAGPAAVFGGAALLVFGAAVAGAVVARAKAGPWQAWIPYLAAVLWALAAVAVGHRSDAPAVAVTAIVLAVVLVAVAALVRPLQPGARRSLLARPEPA